VSALTAQTRLETALTMRRGESVLLTLGIPVALLVFLSIVDVLPLPEGVDDPVDFLFPGVLALAVMSAAMVGPAIAVGFEREHGVLRRLAVTPLGRPRLLGAKVLSILAVEAVQVVVLTIAALALGWRPDGADAALAVAAVALGTVAFAGAGLLLGGTMPGLTTLAAANGLYVVLLLVSGMVFPLEELPSVLAAVARLLPSGALTELLQGALRPDADLPGRAWAVLAAWAVAAPLAAARWFRWR
jgi:ABC-2 type transport system permease protein